MSPFYNDKHYSDQYGPPKNEQSLIHLQQDHVIIEELNHKLMVIDIALAEQGTEEAPQVKSNN